MSEEILSLSDAPEVGEELISEAEAQQLRAKHGEFTVVKTKQGVVALRCPSRAEYQRYNALIFDEKKRPQAFEALVTTCIVKPDSKTYLSWLEKSPGITETCLNAVLELAGVEKDAQTKKYSPA